MANGSLAEEAQTDQCTKQLALDVETNVKYRLNQAVIGLFYVVSVLKTMEVRIQEGMEE